jgi:Tfp pilus assembly pilus retraction ATPase PilT
LSASVSSSFASQESVVARIDSIFKIVREEGASDLHLGAGHAPRLRTFGEIEPIDSAPLSDPQPRELTYEILTDVAELLRQGKITAEVASRNGVEAPKTQGRRKGLPDNVTT